jgi:aminoglycoside phosphotransferase (APT) family kinase protein
MNAWDKNVGLNTNNVIRILEDQLKIKIENIDFIANGWDNDVYKVNNQYLFRFPRRDIANKLIEKEGYALPIIKHYVSVPLPTPIFFGNPTDNYPYRFIGYHYLNDLSIEEIVSVNGIDSISVLATFLSQLHSVPIKKVESIVGYDDLDRLNIQKRKAVLMQNTNAIKNTGIYDTLELESYIDNLKDIKLSNEKVLVHGDLHIRNLLYNKDGIVSSIIDFGDIHIGHRACDISIIYSIIPSEYRNVFFEKYGDVSSATLDFAKFKAIFTNTFLLLHAYDSGNIALVKKVITALNNALG